MEKWKTIEGYPKYMVSNLGRVKSLNYKRSGKEHLCKLSHDKDGYVRINLRNDGKQRKLFVHRLVANAFLSNPENKPQIDHINTVRDDNRVENLRWASGKENMNNPLTRVKISEGNLRSRVQFKKAVYQYSINGELIRKWPSVTEIERETGINRGNISTCCHEGKGCAGGYKWRYAV